MDEQILITGITGCSGSFLAEHLLAKGKRHIYGLARDIENLQNLKGIASSLSLYSVDLRDFKEVSRVIKEIKPTEVYHLASEQFFSLDENWRSIYEINFLGAINLLESLYRLRRKLSLLIVGSSSQYGMVPLSHFPVKEDEPLLPITFYGVSKATQEIAAYPYACDKMMRIIFARTFNLVGPRQKAYLALSNFAYQIARIEKEGLTPIIEVGNIKAGRDFVDVRDAIRAYDLLMEKGKNGEAYNISSGRGITVKEVMEILISLSSVKIEIKVVPERIKPLEILQQVGNYNKLSKLTGWSPEIDIKDSLKDLLNWWRELI